MKSALALLLALLVLVPAPLQLRVAHAAPYQRSGQLSASSGGGGFRAKAKAKIAAIRQGARDAKDTAIEVLRTNGGKAIVGAVLTATLLGIGGNIKETKRSETAELAFSEISQIQKDAAARGESVDPTTMHLAMTNDMIMKVLEANNLAHEHLRSGGEANRFARELQIKMTLDPHRYTLPRFFGGLIDSSAQDVRNVLNPIVRTRSGLGQAQLHLDNAWNYRTHDNYHTEVYTDTESYTDSQGKTQTRTVIKTRQVYDDTDHYWDFKGSEAQAGSQQLDALRQQTPSIQGPRLRTASRTNADNEYAIEKSRKVKDRLSQDSLLHIANTWAHGSTYHQNIGRLEQLWNEMLLRDGHDVRAGLPTSRSLHRNTTSRHEAGPQEFQNVERAVSNSGEFIQRADAVFHGLDYTQRNTRVLEQKIKELIAIEIDRTRTGDSEKLAGEIMQTTREMYQTNFNRGVDLKTYRAWVVMSWIMLGLTLGGAAGYGVGPAIQALKDKLGKKGEGDSFGSSSSQASYYR